MSAISELWTEGRLPIHDGLYYADGRSYEVNQESTSPTGVQILREFDLEALLRADPDWVTRIDIINMKKVGETEGYLCCGEGSYGSEGFVAKMDHARELVWVMYLENSNPFLDIEIGDYGEATFRSASGSCITAKTQGSDF